MQDEGSSFEAYEKPLQYRSKNESALGSGHVHITSEKGNPLFEALLAGASQPTGSSSQLCTSCTKLAADRPAGRHFRRNALTCLKVQLAVTGQPSGMPGAILQHAFKMQLAADRPVGRHL